MNYYKIDVIERMSVDLQVAVTPILMNYIEIPNSIHEGLERCTKCKLKFGVQHLHKISFGKFLCKYCLKGVENV